MRLLKQSTAFIFRAGPFLDSTDGVTAETGLTIAQGDIQISKNGGAFAQTSAASPTTTHDTDGWYQCPLTTTDTGTLGPLTVQITEAGALPVFEHFMCVPANVYDSWVSGSDNLQVDAVQVSGDSTAADNMELDYDGTGYAKANSTMGTVTALTGHTAQTGDSFARIGAGGVSLGDLGGMSTAMKAEVNAEADTANSDYGANTTTPPTVGEVADQVWDEAIADHAGVGSTGEALAAASSAGDPWATALPGAYGAGTAGEIIGDWKNGERLDLTLDAVAADTNELQTDDVPGLIAALNDISTANVATELATYDGPTNTEMNSAFTEIKGATWASGTDTLEHIRNKQTDIETDTNEIGTAGAGLTDINLPNQTMDITGSITGNLSGSVGSVTGAVGSVTGAVASVTGAVGSVTGSVGSVVGHTVQTGDSFALIGTAGAGLTNINLPNQTMDITGDVTGNLSGSVGSVTGAVGSVTGAVGSVTGAVGSVTGDTKQTADHTADITAIKAKTDSLTFTKANEVDSNEQSINGVTLTGDGQVGTEFGV